MVRGAGRRLRQLRRQGRSGPGPAGTGAARRRCDGARRSRLPDAPPRTSTPRGTTKRRSGSARSPPTPRRRGGPYGRYLAARAMIRNATVPAVAALDPYLVPAQEDLRRTLNDPSAAALHASARGTARFHRRRAPDRCERVRDLSVVARDRADRDRQQITDYQRLMDRLLGDTTEFEYASIGRRERDRGIVRAERLDPGDAGHRARRRWTAFSRAGARRAQVQWLVAALWKVPPDARGGRGAAARPPPLSGDVAGIPHGRVPPRASAVSHAATATRRPGACSRPAGRDRAQGSSRRR